MDPYAIFEYSSLSKAMQKGYIDWITRDDNRVFVHEFSQPAHVDKLIRELKFCINRLGYEEIDVDFTSIRAMYPNAAVPTAAALEVFRRAGVDFNLTYGKTYFEIASINQPISIADHKLQLTAACLDRVWIFQTADEVQTLTNYTLKEVSQHMDCEPGVIEAIEWSLNEVMDNVLQHSKVGQGYAMCQVHPISKHFAICVHDTGQGIFNSFRGSMHAPRNPGDAITLAIKEGVTRDPKIGQGNGLWGLHNIVRLNRGSLAITSGGAKLLYNSERSQIKEGLPIVTTDTPSTTVDFQLNAQKKVSMTEVLSSDTISRKYVSPYLDRFETQSEYLLYLIRDQSSGTGTRRSGELIRHEILNLHKDKGRPIIIDFTDVHMISSSFADELIGKLVVEFGFISFTQLIKLINMNETITTIANRSVSMRLSTMLSTPAIPPQKGKSRTL